MNKTLKQKENKGQSSRELLSIPGDGSSRAVVESLFKRPPKNSNGNKPQTFKVARSPLLDQLQTFLPQMQKSTQQLMAMSEEKLESLDIENTEGDSRVLEMNLLLGEVGAGCENENSDQEETSSEESDSEDGGSVLIGPVTESNMKIPSEAKGGKKKGKNLIQVLSDNDSIAEEDKSDSELTIVSSSSGER